MFENLSIRSCKISFSSWFSMARSFKNAEVKLELITDIDRYAIHRYAKANNKYMKDYNKGKESSYLKYWDVNNLYGLAMSQKLPVNKFE